jgi:hypothetical protein
MAQGGQGSLLLIFYFTVRHNALRKTYPSMLYDGALIE